MKTKLIFAFLFCISLGVSAQLKHYLSLNTVVYHDYFNQEKDRARFRWPRFGFFVPAFPNFSYKIERKQLGVELFYNDNGIGYYYGATYTLENLNKDGAIKQVISSHIGLAVHYKALDKKYISINPMAGLVKIWYDETQMALQRHSGGWIEGYPTSNIEKRLGMLAGVNINIPIWKGIYANTNTRYMVFPGAQYNKQNLVFDFGLGYMYQNKAKKK
jgi:hypothetical protein